MKYMVVYDSRTGNTEKVAMRIFETLPGQSKDIQKAAVASGEAEIYFVGFWNFKGACSMEIMELLSNLHGKKIALFGTCGSAGNERYYSQVVSRVAAFIPEDNRYLGGFLCMGRMPLEALQRYQKLQQYHDTLQVRTLIQMYEKAMLHPDQQDLNNAAAFTRKVIEMKEDVYGT